MSLRISESFIISLKTKYVFPTRNYSHQFTEDTNLFILCALNLFVTPSSQKFYTTLYKKKFKKYNEK